MKLCNVILLCVATIFAVALHTVSAGASYGSNYGYGYGGYGYGSPIGYAPLPYYGGGGGGVGNGGFCKYIALNY